MKRGTISTLEVAELLGMHRSTVLSWIRLGTLKYVKTPGGNHRIYPDELIRFLEARNTPIPQELTSFAKTRVLVIDENKKKLEQLTKDVLSKKADQKLTVTSYTSALDAVMELADTRPDVVVMNIDRIDINSEKLCQKLKKRNIKSRVLAISSKKDKTLLNNVKKYGTVRLLVEPLDVAEMKEFIEEAHENLCRS